MNNRRDNKLCSDVPSESYQNSYQRETICSVSIVRKKILCCDNFPSELHQNSHQRIILSMWVLWKILRSDNFLSEHQNSYQRKTTSVSIVKNCFVLIISLQNYIRTHTKEKPYQCEYCEKFCIMISLQNHIRTRTKEILYVWVLWEILCSDFPLSIIFDYFNA